MDTPNLQHVSEGAVIDEAAPCRSCLLDDPARAWWVRSGRADVFAARKEQGAVVGNRHHLFRVEAGQFLFGIEDDESDDGLALLAVGSAETEMVEVDLPRLHAQSYDPAQADAFSTLMERWVKHLSSGIALDVTPKDRQEFDGDQEVSVPPGTCVNPQKGVFWVSHLEGTSRLMGSDALPSINGTGFFPLTSDTWLETEAPCTLLGLSTRDLLEAGTLWENLRTLHAVVRDCVRLMVIRQRQAARTRLQQKGKADEQALTNACSHLMGVLGPKPLPAPLQEDRTNLLLSVCRLIGQRQGIEITAPPEQPSQQGRHDRLGNIARASHLRTRRVVLQDDWWRQDNGPLLGQIEEDRRPVALLPEAPGRYHLHDPATGTVQPVDEAVASTLAPFGYLFYRPFPKDQLRLRDILQFGLHGCKKDLLTILGMGVLVGALGLLNPIATGMIFNTIIPGAERNQLLQVTAILIVSALGIGLFQLTRSLAILRVSGKMGSSIQPAMWDRLLRLPVSFFKDYTAGDLAVRVMGMSRIQQLMSGVVITTLLGAVFSVFDFGLLFYYSSALALWSLLLVGVALGITFALTHYQLRYQRKISTLQSKISGVVLQFLTGISKLRVAGAEAKAFSLWAERFSEQRNLQFRARSASNWMVIFSTVFPVVASMVIYYQAMNLLFEGEVLPTGDFLAFNAAFSKFLAAMLATNSALQAILVSIPFYEHARPILDALPEGSRAATDPGELHGGIEMQHVSFRYTSDGPLILKDVSIHIEPGQFVAIVGTSGSGKSTTLRLLLGFETPDSGSIFYDGQDLAGLDIRAVRRQIGVVLQNGKLLPGDIFTNIVGSSLATMDDAWEAARMAGFDKDVKQMPMGLHTVISEGGSTLSGGQRQRLMIARALVNKPRILFFDEATSALDNQTQNIVSESLDRLQATRIVIAHRLSTVRNADRIYVMDAGRVVEQGAYEELMAQEGVFAELAKRQIA